MGIMRCSHIDLLIRPAIHAQGFHLRNVSAEFAVQRGASHAQEDAQLESPAYQYWQTKHASPCMYSRSSLPTLHRFRQLSLLAHPTSLRERTWVPCAAVRTSVIAWDCLDELLEGSLVARLGALAHGGHVRLGEAIGFGVERRRGDEIWSKTPPTSSALSGWTTHMRLKRKGKGDGPGSLSASMDSSCWFQGTRRKGDRHPAAFLLRVIARPGRPTNPVSSRVFSRGLSVLPLSTRSRLFIEIDR